MLAPRAIFGTLNELFQFFWKSSFWWLIPMIGILLFFAILIVLGNAAGIGPFIYTLF